MEAMEDSVEEANASAPRLCASTSISVDQLFIEILSKMDHKVEKQQMLVVFGIWVVVITVKFVLKRGIKRLCKKKDDEHTDDMVLGATKEV
jgi:hypothetical protein